MRRESVVLVLRAVVIVCGLPLWLGACLNNASPTKKLTNTVHDLNDEARWGRIADASQRVDPTYRQVFIASHAKWGTKIQIADAEVVNMQIAEDGEQAAAFVSYSWYAMDTMTLHQSVVRQRWSSASGAFGLISETVISGDPRLLSSEPASAGGDSGGDPGAAPLSFLNE